MRTNFLFITMVVVLFILSACGTISEQYGGAFEKDDYSDEAEENDNGDVQNQEKEKITSTITPARDLTGKWSGSFKTREDTTDVECLYTGTMLLTLQQRGNALTGTFRLDDIDVQTKNKETDSTIPPIPCGVPVYPTYIEAPVTGQVSSSAIEIYGGGLTQWSGSFTTDLMTLYFKQCVVGPGGCILADKQGSSAKLMRER